VGADADSSEGSGVPRSGPALTADVLCFRPSPSGEGLDFLTVERRFPPHRGDWALPGGFVERGEDLESAARRELLEETGVRPLQLMQLGAYGDPDRDPRRHTVTICYWGFAPPSTEARAGDDAARAVWQAALNPPPLAFDHPRILQDGLARLCELLDATPPHGWLQSAGLEGASRLLELHQALRAGPRTPSQLRRWRRRGLWPPDPAHPGS